MILDNIKNADMYFGVKDKFKDAFSFIAKAINENLSVGKYEIDGKELFASVQEYMPKTKEEAKFEGHRKYIDIQYIISGTETIEVVDISKAVSNTDYNEEKDVQFYKDNINAAKCILQAGEYGIFFPHDIHKPGMAIEGENSPVKKIVVKIKI